MSRVVSHVLKLRSARFVLHFIHAFTVYLCSCIVRFERRT